VQNFAEAQNSGIWRIRFLEFNPAGLGQPTNGQRSRDMTELP